MEAAILTVVLLLAIVYAAIGIILNHCPDDNCKKK